MTPVVVGRMERKGRAGATEGGLRGAGAGAWRANGAGGLAVDVLRRGVATASRGAGAGGRAGGAGQG